MGFRVSYNNEMVLITFVGDLLWDHFILAFFGLSKATNYAISMVCLSPRPILLGVDNGNLVLNFCF